MTSIEYSAFCNCSSLAEVHITDLKAWCEIDFNTSYDNPLYYAKNLYVNGELLINAVIPNGVSSVENYAFYGCESLTSLTIPDSVTSIGDKAFYGCNALVSVHISDIENWCRIQFEGRFANPLAEGAPLFVKNVLVAGEITIPESVVIVNDYIFSTYAPLTGVTISNGVTRIGNGAFYNCDSLTSVVIPDSVTSIGESAFSGCNSLTSVVIPDSVTSIGANAFYYASYNSGNMNVYINDIAAWCGIKFSDRFSTPLGHFGGKLYVNNELVEELIISDTISEIKEYTFYGCDNLKTVTIPASVLAVKAYAFADCDSLKKVIIPSSVTQIVGSAFNQSSLTICGFLGTPAENFAKLKGYTFEPLDDVVYTISYDACGGTNAPAAQSKGHDATFYLSNITPTKAHCTFKGWAVTKGGDVVYQPGDAFSTNTDTTLYAVWDEPTLIVDSATCVTGRNISITISLDHNPGIALVGFKVNYNKDVMTLTSATLGDIFTGELDCNLESVPFVFNAYTGSANKTGDGTLVTLQFAINEDCPEGDYDITLTDIESLNIDEDPVEFICVNGKISVKNSIPGDVNGDGQVTRSDLLRLAKSFSGFTVELDEAAADVTGDGKVTRSDLLRLAKHFSGFDVVLGN